MDAEKHLKRLLFITPGNNLAHLGPALPRIAREQGVAVRADNLLSYRISGNVVPLERVAEMAVRADVILFDFREAGKIVEVLRDVRTRFPEKTFIPLMGGTMEIMGLCRMGPFNMEKMQSRSGGPGKTNYKRIQQITSLIDKLGGLLPVGTLAHARNWVHVIRYWTAGGRENIVNLLHLVLRNYCGGTGPKPSPPVERPVHSLHHPGDDTGYGSIKAYLRARPLQDGLPVIGLLYYGGMHRDASLVGAAALIDAFRGRADVLPVATDGVGSLEAVKRFLAAPSSPKIDALISLLWFRLNGGPLGGDPEETRALLTKLGVPYIVPATMYGRELDTWKESAQGLSPVETYATVVLPELDGATGPVPLLGLALQETDSFQVTNAVALPERAEAVAERTLAWIGLTRKPESEKKVALIAYDYPPGPGNAGNASYLDVSRSLTNIISHLAASGYDIGNGPGRENPLKHLLDHGVCNRDAGRSWHGAYLSADDYKKAFDRYPSEIRQQVLSAYGPPPGGLMTAEQGLKIPGMWFGNIMVALQPARMPFGDGGSAVHDKNLPPHHQYLAFYEYVKQQDVDVVVHVGTHGTAEFTPGKETALSAACYPDLMQGTIPQVYIYTIANPSESVIARRRWQATLLSHHIPDFVPAELYGEYRDILDRIERLRTPGVSDQQHAEIVNTVRELAESLDLPFETIDELEHELSGLQQASIPEGLHVYGRPKDGRSLVRYSVQLFQRQVAGIHVAGIARNVDSGEDTATLLDRWARQFVETGGLPTELRRRLPKPAAAALEGDLLELARNYLADNELAALTESLQGRFIPPGLMGDPQRSPGVYPTGRNGCTFDPARIPFPDAVRRGESMARALVEKHRAAHGTPPGTMGLVLWGFETARTGGETIGQLLYLIGARLKDAPGWLPVFEPIPADELDRPRVDVYLMICGFFRDMFPTLVRDLDLLMREIQAADNTRPAGPRIFGPAPGQYGTGLPDYVEESNWTENADLGNVYESAMGYAYGARQHGEEERGVFAALLERTDTVSQVIDGDEYKIGDLDHYYEFLGGATRAVENRSGKKPLCLVGDSARNTPRLAEAETELRRYGISRLLNPKWINGMLAHEHHGTKKIAERVTNLIGLAGTVGVPPSMFNRVFERFIEDEELFARLRDDNPHAAADLVRRVGEADERRFWAPTSEQRDLIRQRFLSLEADLES